MKKKSEAERRTELRGLMQQEVEKDLISHDDLGQMGSAVASDTNELTCKCWCSTGLLSTCAAGTVGSDAALGRIVRERRAESDTTSTQWHAGRRGKAGGSPHGSGRLRLNGSLRHRPEA
jgi:hypothetical protein